ncbi:MAG TPA: RcnB family protein [Caulobacteraceae bacterium]
MKKLLLGAAALGLLAADVAAAQTTVRTDRQGDTRVITRQRDGDRVVREYQRDGDVVVRKNGNVVRRNDRRYYYGGRAYTAVRGPRWVAPRGWAYRRYAIGTSLPGFFLSTSYYVDPVRFGLRVGPAGYGRRWVRVGNDLYLVNARGRVFQVVPNVFYY